MKLNWLHFLTLTILLAGLIIQPSCRKIDQQTDETNLKTQLSKFFTDHTSNKPLVQSINQYFKRLNDKEAFIGKTIEKIGYPRWDKAITVSFSGSLNRGESNSTELTYIPFVREEETFVNASLLVQTSPTDTAFKYVCDWEYQYRQNGTLEDTSVTAERIAFTLMTLDKEVFGHTKFKITDSKLFENYFPDSLRGNQSYLELDSVSSFGNRTEAMAAPITFTVYCGACVSMYWQIIYYYNLNGIPTWEFPSGGGGGGGTSTPPDCPGIPVARTENVTNPCEPGWIPIPPEPPPYASNPCTVVDSLLKTNSFPQLLNNLRDSTPIHHEIGYSFTLPDTSNNTHTYYAGQGALAVNIDPTSPVDGIMHNHYDTAGRHLIFSAEDITYLAQLFVRNEIKDLKTFTFTLVTDSSAYTLMISDSIKFSNFINTWLDTDKHMRDFATIFYDTYNVAGNGLTTAQKEKNFLEALKRTMEFVQQDGIGLKLFRGNPNMSIFTPIKLNANGQVRPDPC